MKLMQFFPCKKAFYVRRQDFLDNFAFYSLDVYGAGTRTVTCQKSDPEPEP
jgi:hypothetical protein